MTVTNHIPMLGEAFRYPSADFLQRVGECQAMLRDKYPEAAMEFEKFANYLADKPIQEIEELYVKTFDIQAICYLDIGFVLFGEDYKRGMFLVHMKQEHRRAGTDYGTDLPDHLSSVLKLLDKTPDQAFRDDLVGNILMPALRKMIGEFETSRVRSRIEVLKKKHDAIVQETLNYGNVYQFALKTLLMVLEQEFSHIKSSETGKPGSKVIPIMPDLNSLPSIYSQGV